MNGTEQTLIQRAFAERQTLGYLTEETRATLMDAGYEAQRIEAVLLNMERASNGN